QAGAGRLWRAANNAASGRLKDALGWGFMWSANPQTRGQIEHLRRQAEERARAWVSAMLAEAEQRKLAPPTPVVAPPSEGRPSGGPVAAPPVAPVVPFSEGAYV